VTKKEKKQSNTKQLPFIKMKHEKRQIEY